MEMRFGRMAEARLRPWRDHRGSRLQRLVKTRLQLWKGFAFGPFGLPDAGHEGSRHPIGLDAAYGSRPMAYGLGKGDAELPFHIDDSIN